MAYLIRISPNLLLVYFNITENVHPINKRIVDKTIYGSISLYLLLIINPTINIANPKNNALSIAKVTITEITITKTLKISSLV